MNTATTLLNGVTVTAAAQQAAGAASVDLNAITANDVVFEVLVTNGGTSPGTGKSIDVYIGWASTSIASNIPATVGPTAEKIKIGLSSVADESRVAMSGPSLKKARYLYIWYSHEDFNAAVTLTAKIIS